MNSYQPAKLKAILIEKGISRESIAKEMGMSLTTFQYKLNGKTEFKVSEVFKLCRLLEIDDKESIFFGNHVDE
jgi:transcriptional regulator with XRE-family HTH domain